MTLSDLLPMLDGVKREISLDLCKLYREVVNRGE